MVAVQRSLCYNNGESGPLAVGSLGKPFSRRVGWTQGAHSEPGLAILDRKTMEG